MIDEKKVAVASATKSGVPDGWREVRFDEIAQLVNDRVDNPAEAGVERYVGLEHLDPESLKIRRWGVPTDVEAQKLRFQPGDIIFGKRRAYQRKVAVADFEGICSAHAMVLRAREENVVKEFLPFFMQSNTFFDRALSISVGSLSPTINWKTLAGQKFALPPNDEQRRISDILWAADEVIDKLSAALESHAQFTDVVMKNAFSKGLEHHTSFMQSNFGQVPSHWKIQTISEVANVAYGISEAVAGNTDPSIGCPILTGANITLDGRIDTSKLNYIKEPTKESFILKKGDLLLNWRSGSPEHVGKTAIYNLDGLTTYASFVLRIRVGSNINNVFLHRLLNFMRRNKLFGGSTSQQVNFKMNAAMFRDVLIVVPPMPEQLKMVETFNEVEAARAKIEMHITAIKTLKSEMLKHYVQ